MITNTISIENFNTSHRWNAEFFINTHNKVKESKNYTIQKISDLVEERKEFLTPNNFNQTLFNYIGLENISKNTRHLVNFKPKLGLEIKSRCKVFREGDILYGRLRPSLNKALLITDEITEGICSTEIFVLKPNKDIINPNYLAEILTSKIILDRVGNITAGAALPRMQIKDFLNLDIPVLPMKKQIAFVKNTLEARKKAKRLSEQANHIFSELPNAFINAIESDAQQIIIPIVIESIILNTNTLPD